MIWLGIASFFVGSIGVGATLAARQVAGAVAPAPGAGLALLSLGVAYVGIGFAMEPTGSPYDPDLALPDWHRVLMAVLAGPFAAVGLLLLATSVS
jgi:hypothetical protein